MRTISAVILAMTVFSCHSIFASPYNDTTIKFDRRYSQCENKWVIFPGTSSNNYRFGFIYLDEMAGFTFHMSGAFSVEGNKYVIDTAMESMLKTAMIKTRLQPNTRKVALLSEARRKELQLPVVPDWLDIYQSHTDTMKRNVKWGWHYNHVGESEIALQYLEKSYKKKPHYDGLEFELAYAYNVLGRYDDAIKVLTAAIAQNKEMLFYRELGFAYLRKQDFSKAYENYEKGIELCTDKEMTSKAEMAANMASGYRFQKNDAKYREWALKAKEWAPKDSGVYKWVIQQGL